MHSTEAPQPASLVERLQAAAVAAIANETADLEREPGRLRGVMVELRLNGHGAITDGTCYVERKIPLRKGEPS